MLFGAWAVSPSWGAGKGASAKGPGCKWGEVWGDRGGRSRGNGSSAGHQTRNCWHGALRRLSFGSDKFVRIFGFGPGSCYRLNCVSSPASLPPHPPPPQIHVLES